MRRGVFHRGALPNTAAVSTKIHPEKIFIGRWRGRTVKTSNPTVMTLEKLCVRLSMKTASGRPRLPRRRQSPDARARCASGDSSRTPRNCLSALLDVGAVSRGWSVNPSIHLGRIERNDLDGNVGCQDRAFIADDVNVTVTGIDQGRGRLSLHEGVDMGSAI